MTSSHKNFSTEKCKDSGLALLLICLICYQVWKQPVLIPAAIIILLLTMTCPRIFQPFARFWFGLSNIMGSFVSRMILALLFFALVLPVGLVRRVMGKDSMQLKCWKQGHESVFRVRAQKFVAGDLEFPY